MKEWITGRNPVYEALRTNRRQFFRLWIAEGVEDSRRLSEIQSLAMQRRLPVERVPRSRLNALGENPQGVALEASQYPYVALDDILAAARDRSDPLFVLILDVIQNPQNLGSLLRTAEAVGVHGAVIPLARAARVSPAVVSASAGACEHLLIAQANLAQALTKLKEAGAWVVGLEALPEALPPERVPLDGPLALVVGSEGEGMRALVRRSCDFLVRLPMRGQVGSLNAAVAGSIALYLAYRAREAAVNPPSTR